MHKSPFAANNTDKLPRTAAQHRRNQNESNRYCEKNRRPRQSRHTKRDSPNAPDQDGRPLTENIDTGYPVLHECGIRCGAVHREVNDMPAGAPRPPHDWQSGGGLRYYISRLHERFPFCTVQTDHALPFCGQYGRHTDGIPHCSAPGKCCG